MPMVVKKEKTMVGQVEVVIPSLLSATQQLPQVAMLNGVNWCPGMVARRFMNGV